MKTISEALGTLFEPAKSHPEWANSIALVGNDKRTLTFNELEQTIKHFAAALASCGVNKQDRVIISAPNSPEYIATLLASWKLGAVAIPVDFRLTPEETINVVNSMKPAVFIGFGQNCQAINQSREKLSGTTTPKILELSAIAKQENSAQSISDKIEVDSAAFVILTSGTTGIPKGALHDLSSLAANVAELGEMSQIQPGAKLLLPLPLSHIFGLEVCLTGLFCGASVTFTLTPEDFLKTLASQPFEIVAGVPALYSAMLTLPQGTFDLKQSNILLSGGASLPQSLADEFRHRFGRRLNNGYGSTEMKIIALNLEGPDLSVGKLVPSAQAKFLDSDHRPSLAGEVGELCIEGPTLMQGYFEQPAETEKVLHDHHYHTGDLGYVKDGYVYISGRDKELINVAGNKVFPSEVEDVLRQHENVKEVAVLGVPHYRLGQLVKAVIVIKDPTLSDRLAESEDTKRAARQELLNSFKDFCKEHLKKELRPMEWEFRCCKDVLPKTNTGKIDKKKLQPATA